MRNIGRAKKPFSSAIAKRKKIPNGAKALFDNDVRTKKLGNLTLTEDAIWGIFLPLRHPREGCEKFFCNKRI